MHISLVYRFKTAAAAVVVVAVRCNFVSIFCLPSQAQAWKTFMCVHCTECSCTQFTQCVASETHFTLNKYIFLYVYEHISILLLSITDRELSLSFFAWPTVCLRRTNSAQSRMVLQTLRKKEIRQTTLHLKKIVTRFTQSKNRKQFPAKKPHEPWIMHPKMERNDIGSRKTRTQPEDEDEEANKK